MKKNVLKFVAIGSLSFLFSCGGAETKTEQVTEEKVVENIGDCTYSYSKENTQVSWVAFKTTKKIGVGGEFLDFTIEGTKESKNVLDVIEGASISIPVASVETKDVGRNQRIVEYFFGTFTDTEKLTGTVKEVKDDGTGSLTLKMNGIESDIPVNFEVEDNKVTVATTIDLNNWDGQAAVDALNEACEGLHAGEDGVTKLWPEVEITITSELNKTCE